MDLSGNVTISLFSVLRVTSPLRNDTTVRLLSLRIRLARASLRGKFSLKSSLIALRARAYSTEPLPSGLSNVTLQLGVSSVCLPFAEMVCVCMIDLSLLNYRVASWQRQIERGQDSYPCPLFETTQATTTAKHFGEWHSTILSIHSENRRIVFAFTS